MPPKTTLLLSPPETTCYIDENGEVCARPGPHRVPIRLEDPASIKMWQQQREAIMAVDEEINAGEKTQLKPTAKRRPRCTAVSAIERSMPRPPASVSKLVFDDVQEAADLEADKSRRTHPQQPPKRGPKPPSTPPPQAMLNKAKAPSTPTTPPPQAMLKHQPKRCPDAANMGTMRRETEPGEPAELAKAKAKAALVGEELEKAKAELAEQAELASVQQELEDQKSEVARLKKRLKRASEGDEASAESGKPAAYAFSHMVAQTGVDRADLPWRAGEHRRPPQSASNLVTTVEESVKKLNRLANSKWPKTPPVRLDGQHESVHNVVTALTPGIAYSNEDPDINGPWSNGFKHKRDADGRRVLATARETRDWKRGYLEMWLDDNRKNRLRHGFKRCFCALCLPVLKGPLCPPWRNQ